MGRDILVKYCPVARYLFMGSKGIKKSARAVKHEEKDLCEPPQAKAKIYL